VSGFCDEQQGKTARSNQGIAASLGIPALLVDLRHAASHKAMPSLQELRVARPIILKWLRNNYWEKQANYLQDARRTVQQLLELYVAERVRKARIAFTKMC
jgi:hypothetical protein